MPKRGTRPSAVCDVHPPVPKARKRLEPEDAAALKWINSYLHANPAYILKCKAKMETGWLEKAANDLSEDYFNDTYTYFKKIPKYFYATFMVEEGIMTQALADEVDAKDPQAIRYLAIFFFGVPDNLPLPPQLTHKPTLCIFLRARGVLLGHRWRGFFDKALRADFTINWVKYGCYRFLFKDAETKQAHAIKHTSTEPIKIMDFLVTREWKVKNNHDDLGATGCSGKHRPLLLDFFDEPFLDPFRFGKLLMRADAE